jgi:hypothetical protein
VPVTCAAFVRVIGCCRLNLQRASNSTQIRAWVEVRTSGFAFSNTPFFTLWIQLLIGRVHGRTRHFKIYNYGPGRFGFGGGEFASLRELVDHYTTDVPVYDNVFLGTGVELETQPPAETLYPCPPVPARKPPVCFFF